MLGSSEDRTVVGQADEIGLGENRNGSLALTDATTRWPYLVGWFPVGPVRVIGQPVGSQNQCTR